MTFFDRFRKDPIETALENLYTEMLTQMGTAPSEARKTVRQAILGCKKEARQENTHDLPANFGVQLLLDAARNRQPAMQIVRNARTDGATDQDIVGWWNLPDIQRRMTWWSESVFRYMNFCDFLKTDGDADQAMRRVRCMFPMYGDPNDVQHVQGEDRPLPDELRDRIDRYRERVGARAIRERCEAFSSYNAFVRSQVRSGIV